MVHLHDVDLKLLRVFAAVVRCGGFSAAQAELNVSQSTISTQISQLESRLGLRLCERGRAGFRLTDSGRVVHEAAQRLFGAIDNFRIEVDAEGNTVVGTLNLGVIDNTVTDPCSPICGAVQRFVTRGPHVGIQIYIGTPSELEQRVLDGRLHVAVGHFPFRVPGLTSVPLYKEVHGLFCSSHNRLATGEMSERKLIEQLTINRVVARGYLRGQDLKVLRVDTAASTTDNVEAQAILILSGACVGFLPLHYAATWVAKGELKRLLPRRMIVRSPFSTITRRMSLPLLVRSFLADLETGIK